MPLLWTPPGRVEIRSLVASETLLAFDFDGTLVPHAPPPGQLVVSSETLYLLRELKAFAPLAVITGRTLEDVSGHLDPSTLLVLGNYGIESPWATAVKKAEAERDCAGIREALRVSPCPDPPAWRTSGTPSPCTRRTSASRVGSRAGSRRASPKGRFPIAGSSSASGR